ncbi:MAG TPA: ornithine cyclodeaminase family protein [Candidatus Acidoferrales bacterium]|nr:ornithine cyclodeaminase family protein [Candidatus Acidoferrales bacterium]
MLLIDNQTVAEILDIKGCMDALETGYNDLIQERANYRGRYDFFVPNDDPKLMYRWGTMEGASRSFETMAIRMKSDMLEWPEGQTVEKYCVERGTFCGIVMVFSTRNGEPLAIINDGIIQHMRVGGCAGLGAKYLSREDSSVVGIFGSGGMARTYLLAFNEVRKIREVRVYSPTKKNRQDYADEMSQKLGFKIVPVNDPREVVRGSDIVATCTDSIQVIVNDPSWIEPGMHLTCVKSNEWSPEIVQKSDLVIKTGRPTLNLDVGQMRIGGEASVVAGNAEEIKRIANPKVDIFSQDFPVLTDIMSGKLKGRTDAKQVTFFANSGTQGLQFASTAGYVVREAKKRGLGQEIPTGWFLQDIRD